VIRIETCPYRKEATRKTQQRTEIPWCLKKHRKSPKTFLGDVVTRSGGFDTILEHEYLVETRWPPSGLLGPGARHCCCADVVEEWLRAENRGRTEVVDQVVGLHTLSLSSVKRGIHVEERATEVGEV
jgi:hypothetical protein